MPFLPNGLLTVALPTRLLSAPGPSCTVLLHNSSIAVYSPATPQTGILTSSFHGVHGFYHRASRVSFSRASPFPEAHSFLRRLYCPTAVCARDYMRFNAAEFLFWNPHFGPVLSTCIVPHFLPLVVGSLSMRIKSPTACSLLLFSSEPECTVTQSNGPPLNSLASTVEAYTTPDRQLTPSSDLHIDCFDS